MMAQTCRQTDRHTDISFLFFCSQNHSNCSFPGTCFSLFVCSPTHSNCSFLFQLNCSHFIQKHLRILLTCNCLVLWFLQRQELFFSHWKCCGSLLVRVWLCQTMWCVPPNNTTFLYCSEEQQATDTLSSSPQAPISPWVS